MTHHTRIHLDDWATKTPSIGWREHWQETSLFTVKTMLCFDLQFPLHQTSPNYWRIYSRYFWEIEKTTYHPNRRSKEKQNGFTGWVITSLWMCVYPHNSTMFNIVQPCSTILPQFCVWNPAMGPHGHTFLILSPFLMHKTSPFWSVINTPHQDQPVDENQRTAQSRLGPRGQLIGRTPPENQKSSAAVIILQDLRFSFAP